MKKQMDRSTFGYRLHFKNKPAEELASMTASLMPKNINKIFLHLVVLRPLKAVSN